MLLPRSTFQIKEVIAIFEGEIGQYTQFRVLDFKRGCSLNRTGPRTFAPGASFDHLCDEERRQQRWLAGDDVG